MKGRCLGDGRTVKVRQDTSGCASAYIITPIGAPLRASKPVNRRRRLQQLSRDCLTIVSREGVPSVPSMLVEQHHLDIVS